MFISIIIPAYNSNYMLIRTIKRIFKILKNKKFEIIVINDASNNKLSFKVFNKIQKMKNVSLIFNSKNLGQHNSTIKGLKKARGKFIITLDDDFRHDPKNIIPMIDLMKRKKLDIVYEINTFRYSYIRFYISKINQILLNRSFKHLKNKTTSSYRLLTNNFCKKIILKKNYNPNLSCVALKNTKKIGNLKVKYKFNNYKMRYTLLKLINLHSHLTKEFLKNF